MHFYNYFNEFKLITIMSFKALASQIPVKNSKST